MIKDTLVLDHFYVAFTDQQFADLAKIQKHLNRINYREVQSGDRSWRGYYLWSNVGSYFEMLEASRSYSLGVAFSGHRVTYIDVRRILTELKTLPWATENVMWADSGKIWFESLSLNGKRDLKNRAPLESWIMHYHPVHSVASEVKPEQASLDRFKRLVLEMGEDHREQIKFHSQWFPGKQNFSKRGAELIIPNRDGGDFNIQIKFKKGDSKARFIELESTACPCVKVKPLKTKSNPKSHLAIPPWLTKNRCVN